MTKDEEIKSLLGQFFELLHVIEINDYSIKRDDLFEICSNYADSKSLMITCNRLKIDID